MKERKTVPTAPEATVYVPFSTSMIEGHSIYEH